MSAAAVETTALSSSGDRTRSERRIPGEAGVWVFLFGDLGIFVVFFVAFLLERAEARAVFDTAQAEIGFTTGFVNTLVLLTSSLFVVIGLEGLRRGIRNRAVTAFAGAMVLGGMFVVLKITEYTHLIADGHGPDANAYFTWFFVLTGVHLLHVLIGLGVLALMISKARQTGEGGEKRLTVVESGACFWHLVDLLWMIIFPLLYLVG